MDAMINSDDPRPLLIVHIGGAKSGSTAIQEFLFGNRNALHEMGLAVPDTEFSLGSGRSNQIWFFQDLVEKEIAGTLEASLIVEKQVDALWSSFTATPGVRPRGIILSAENLANNNGLHQTFVALKKRFRICLVLYVRRQEEFYHSAWQQWFVKRRPSIDSWLHDWNGEWCDWAGTLERWESIEPDMIAVRLFERSALIGGDIIDDFCSVIGLDVNSFRRPVGDMNVTLGVHVSELYHSMSDIFEGLHDHSVEAHFVQFGGKAAHKRPHEWLFSREQFEFIRLRHLAGNARVKNTYFPELQRKELFPKIPDTDTFRPPQSEMHQRNLGVLGELSVRQYREIEAELIEIKSKLEQIDQKVDKSILGISHPFERGAKKIKAVIERLKSR